MWFGAVGVDHVAQSTIATLRWMLARPETAHDRHTGLRPTHQHAAKDEAGRGKENQEREDVGHEAWCQQKSARHHDENAVDDFSGGNSSFQNAAVELRPDPDPFPLHQPAAQNCNEDDETKSVEEADRRAHSNDHVELDHRKHDEEQKKDHDFTLTTGARVGRSATMIEVVDSGLAFRTMGSVDSTSRPPSVDALARSLSHIDLPHPLLVDVARQAIASGDHHRAESMALDLRAAMLQPVINATGVIAHTNLGRSPVAVHVESRAQNLEFDLRTGRRGSRQSGIGRLLARAVGAEAAMVVNNNAAAVLLVLAALAHDRDVAVSRGESVEIGGGFRVPEVMEQSGARLVDVGTTNRTRLDDYRKAIQRKGTDVALVLKVHPSNYRVEGFVEETPVSQLSTLGVDVVADIGSGLLDEACPWLPSGPPDWLRGEPAARQSLEAGASLVTFSGDKLLGGPQSGVIAGRADLVARCAAHPLARALRPGGLVLSALHDVTIRYLDRTACEHVPFWKMATASADSIRHRCDQVVDGARIGKVIACDSLPGAGSTPGAHIPSFGIELDGDVTATFRDRELPIVARVRDDRTVLDLRTVAPDDDQHVVTALRDLFVS